MTRLLAVLKRVVFPLAQCSWGGLQTLLGFFLFLFFLRKRHQLYRGALLTDWGRPGGLCLGLFLFADFSDPRGEGLFAHEYGHSLQSLLLGPLYLMLIGLPSFLWANLPFCRRYRTHKKRAYGFFYTERWADSIARGLRREDG